MQDSATTDNAPNGSLSLLQTLIEHRSGLINTATRITGCRSHAEDVVQDAFLRICNLTSDASVFKVRLNYVARIVRNLAIDHYRKQATEQRYISHDDENLNAVPHPASPESINVDRQTLGTVEHALALLPERTRYVFVMYRVHGKSQKDLAAELGVSPTLVNFMIRDALLHCEKIVTRSRNG